MAFTVEEEEETCNGLGTIDCFCGGDLCVCEWNGEIPRGAGIVPHLIIEGGARGVDTLAFDYAFDHGLGWSVYQADWKKYGRAAGPIRNRRMAEHADALIAVWDGESRGTKNMIDEATRRGLKVFIFRIQPIATPSALETGE